MTKRIFLANFCSAIVIALLCSLLVSLVTYGQFLKKESKELQTQAQLAVHGVQKLGLDYFTDIKLNHYRLTWVNSEGIVLYDSHNKADEMENHLLREEIEQAILYGVGTSKRNSQTLMEEQVYYALRLEDGTVLRVSTNQNTLYAFFYALLQPFVLILLCSGGISCGFAYFLTKSIMKPLSTLDLEHPWKNTTAYEEIIPLLTKIQRQYQKNEEHIREMAQQKEEFDTITRKMAEGLVLLNPEWQILSLNDSASQFFETDKESCLGRNVVMLHRSKELQQLLEEAFQGQHSEGIITVNTQEYQVNVSPVLHEERLSGVAILLVNATEKREIEQIRREFTANVSHELKTPLHSISGCAELLQHNLVQEADIPQFSQQIYHEAQRLIRLVEEIINLSRLDEGGVDLPQEEVDLASVAREVCLNLEDLAKENQLTLDFQGESALMYGNYPLLTAVVRNLCENAIKYNRQLGSVTVTVVAQEKSLHLQVKDTGIGVEEKEKQLIFQRFYRVDKSRSKEIGGTGLGLSIVKHGVAFHHGTLSIESEWGEGTTIEVEFPKIAKKIL